MEILSHSREESLQTLDRRKASIESHRKILSAIEQHNRTKAQEAMFHHIEQVEENVLSSRKPQANHNNNRLEERSVS
jgi:DNA-binding GntR family transcriptional regulator